MIHAFTPAQPDCTGCAWPGNCPCFDREGDALRHTPQGDFECCRRPRRPREQWSFLAREQHWGHTFLVWTLTGNPSARNEMGKRFVRWVK